MNTMKNNIFLQSSLEDWQKQLNDVVTEPNELLHLLCLDHKNELIIGNRAKKLFSLRVPRTFIQRMNKGDIKDPLLLQVLTNYQEFNIKSNFDIDPLNETKNNIPNLLHKYKNRVLLLVKNECAVHCRYCFRRYFPYKKHPGNKTNWQKAIDYISQTVELDEIILSGGDPLMAKDHELHWLVQKLENISHLKRLRIHTRLPVVIPKRITLNLCKILSKSKKQIILVTHINHAQEINKELTNSMKLLKQANVLLLNQSVLLRGINNCSNILANLSNALFDSGILPYYLHLLDKTQGTEHFFVSDDEARMLIFKLMEQVSGYLVPKIVREISCMPHKIPLEW